MASRSSFAQDCVDYIYASINDSKWCITSCVHILDLLEKHHDKIGERDERDICSYILDQIKWPADRKRETSQEGRAALMRVQAIYLKRIQRMLEENLKPNAKMAHYYAIKEERSPFAFTCVQYIAAARSDRKDIKAHVEAATHIIDLIEKPSDPITDFDRREICGYIERSFLFCDYDKKDREALTQPLLARVQAMYDKLIQAALEPPVKTTTNPDKTPDVKKEEVEGVPSKISKTDIKEEQVEGVPSRRQVHASLHHFIDATEGVPSKTSKSSDKGQVHTSSHRFVDGTETPEGQAVGLVKPKGRGKTKWTKFDLYKS